MLCKIFTTRQKSRLRKSKEFSYIRYFCNKIIIHSKNFRLPNLKLINNTLHHSYMWRRPIFINIAAVAHILTLRRPTCQNWHTKVSYSSHGSAWTAMSKRWKSMRFILTVRYLIKFFKGSILVRDIFQLHDFNFPCISNFSYKLSDFFENT